MVGKHEEISEEVIIPDDVIVYDNNVLAPPKEIFKYQDNYEEHQMKLDDYFKFKDNDINHDMDID